MKAKTSENSQKGNTSELLQKWQYAIRICHKAHIRSAAHMNRRHRVLGIVVVILSTIVGTSVFATLDSSPKTWVKILVGFLSVAAAVFAGLQTFLNYSEKEEMHRVASQKYGALRREIEEFLVLPKGMNDNPEDFLINIRSRWDAIDNDSPSLSQKLYDKIAKGIRTESLRREKNN
ncbi:DUF4231 domain-containing protein [Flavobacteriaceae bacterium TP-CH-4]|uniref:DUF4231 domain-containing protein n=1 Tax=Pelagihabitans pacificus TaxID=2696054 RepID=A0A967EC93_9FLAO|nr:DUF4231 domain-containing protein [Pelagihabitans pacificus]NHF58038.1 DUF4231 domain-containing protein [Pelagihabitans pacificus]